MNHRTGGRPFSRALGGTVVAGVASLVLAGCQSIPEDATVKAFCSEGEKFSASTNWKDGVAAAKKLEATGTPAGIGADAREGFVELVNRVLDSDNGGDFRAKTKGLDQGERKRLEALSAYIAKTCDLS